MNGDPLTAFTLIGVFIFFLAVISAGLIRWLSGDKVTLQQAFFVGLLAHFIGIALLMVYFAIKRYIAIPREVDSITTIVELCIVGIIITRRLRAYGVEKTGWLGVGGRTILGLLVLSWIFVGVYFVFNLMK